MNLKSKLNRGLLAGSALAATASLAHASAFISGNDLVVAQIGDGSTSYTGQAAPVILDEYNISGASPVLVNTIALSSTGGSSVTESYGTGGRDGYLTLSPNGQFLTFAGYRANAGASDPAGTTAATDPRVVAIIGSDGSADTSTALTSGTTSNFRSAVTTDGNSIWATDNSGGATSLFYTTKGSSTTSDITVSTAGGWRSVTVAGGQLYGATGSTPKGVYAINDSSSTPSLPKGTTAATSTVLTGDSSADVTFLDLSPTVPGVDTMYIAESAGFAKYSLVGSSWVSNGIDADSTDYITGVDAISNGIGGENVFFSTDKGVYKMSDTGYNTPLASVSVGSYYITPGANENFRGVATAPSAVPEPTTLGLLTAGGIALLGRRRQK